MKTSSVNQGIDWPQFSSIVLNRRQIFILPTQMGLLFALMLFVMLLGSMNYDNSMGYLLTFLLGSTAIVSILHTYRNLLKLRVEAGKVTSAFAGDTVLFELLVDNQGCAARYALVWQCAASQNNQRDLSLTIDVPTNQRVSMFFPVLTNQRGRFFLGRVTVSSRFPLGLFYAWSHFYLDISAIVYPQPKGHHQLPHGLFHENNEGVRLSNSGGEDFVGYRDYQLGDSPRHIDWKAVARGQDWFIKQFGGVGATTFWLTWDDVSQLNNLEAGLSQLCLWILVAERQGAQYGLKMPDCTIEPAIGQRHRDNCLQKLALYALPSSNQSAS